MTTTRQEFHRLQNVDEWNRQRLANPGWLPVFAGADLSGWDLRGADLRQVDLRKADLRKTDLRKADLRGTDLTGANLSGAKLWKSLRDGWKVADAECDGVCWDQKGEQCLLLYGPGQFAEIHGQSPTFLILGDNLAVEPEIFLLLANLIAERGPPKVSLRLPNTFTIVPQPETAITPNSQSPNELHRVRALEHQMLKYKEMLGSLSVQTHPFLKGGSKFSAIGDRGYFTVLKADIVGYSRLPENKRRKIEAYLDRFGKGIFEEYGACWANDTGDALTAAFDDVGKAANAALELVATIDSLGVSMRAALAGGELEWVDRFNQGRPALRGEAIIRAARLEPLVQPGQVYADKDTDIDGLSSAGLELTPLSVQNKKAFEGVNIGDMIDVYSITRQKRSR